MMRMAAQTNAVPNLVATGILRIGQEYRSSSHEETSSAVYLCATSRQTVCGDKPINKKGEEGNSFQFVSVATVGIHERERSESSVGPPGSRSRHLESVSRTSRDVHQRPDLLAGRSAMSTNV